jgi:hypothetical protein
LVVVAPVLALGFAGWDAFLPVALTSVLGGTLCFMSQGIFTQIHVAELTAELMHDLVSVDQQDKELVLSCLNKIERAWFLAELPRARAELRRRYWKRRNGRHRWSVTVKLILRRPSELPSDSGHLSARTCRSGRETCVF